MYNGDWVLVMPLVSVIVPVYNVENVLHYCVESILNQSFTDFELILVDDGSPDNSGEICDEYAKKDSRIVVIHKENGGVSSARNAGIERTTGEFICFIDSDDYVDNNYLESLLKAKNNHPDIDNIWCGFRTIDSYSFNAKTIKEVLFDVNSDVSFCDISIIMTLHERWLNAGPYCKLYISKIIQSNNLSFDNDLSLGEDLKFNFEYLDCTNGEILVVNKALYSYYISSTNSLGSKYYSDLLGIYQHLNNMMKHYIYKWKCDDTQYGKFYSACFFKYEVILKNTFSEKNNAPKKEKLIFNNRIMKSSEFKNTLANMTYKPNCLYLLAYKSGRYSLVRFLDRIFKFL